MTELKSFPGEYKWEIGKGKCICRRVFKWIALCVGLVLRGLLNSLPVKIPEKGFGMIDMFWK